MGILTRQGQHDDTASLSVAKWLAKIRDGSISFFVSFSSAKQFLRIYYNYALKEMDKEFLLA